MPPASTSAARPTLWPYRRIGTIEPVREFPSFTVDLNALADWLEACGVDTVAMESTGVYWIPLFELLESRGFTVLLVNARHVKNVSGRKSDVLDCQWLQQLMTYGLLSGAFRPADAGVRSALRCGASAECCSRARPGMCSTCKRRSRR